MDRALIWKGLEAHHITTKQGKEFSFSSLLKRINNLMGMKSLIGITLSVLLFIVFTLLYLNYDKKSYNYGNGCDFCSKKLPYNLVPKFYRDYPQRFYLLDDDGFELVGSGFRYETTNFTVTDFLAYGYNDTSIIAKCTDSLKNIKYLISYKTGYISKKGNPEISFKDLSNSKFEQTKNNYQWVDVDKEKANNFRFMKFIFMIGALLSLFFIIQKLFKLINKKATH
jgi:hypothetical protein